MTNSAERPVAQGREENLGVALMGTFLMDLATGKERMGARLRQPGWTEVSEVYGVFNSWMVEN